MSTEKTELIPAARYLPARLRGRPTLYRKFLEQQSDLFPMVLMAAHLGSAPRQAPQRAAGARGACVGAAMPPGTNRGGKVETDQEKRRAEVEQYLRFVEEAFCNE